MNAYTRGADYRVHRRLCVVKVHYKEEKVYHVHTITILHTLVCTCVVQPDFCSPAGRLWWERNRRHYIYTSSDTYIPTSVANCGNWRHDRLSGQRLYHQLSTNLAN